MYREIKWILMHSMLLVSLFFGCQRTVQAQNAPVVTVGTVQKAVPGDQVTIPVTVSNFNNIGSVSLSLDYDPTKLKFVSATPNPLLGGSFGDNVIAIDKHRLVMGWFNLNTGTSLPNGAIIVNYIFTYLSGSPTLQWYNDGTSCIFTDPLTRKLNDIPTSTYYINGSVCEALPPTVLVAGTNSVYFGQTGVEYSVPLDPAISYSWIYSGTGATIVGTNNIVKIDFSPSATPGTLTVTASNACRASKGVIDISLHQLIKPTFTTGPTNVDLRSSGNLYTTQSGKTNYIWTVTGGIITSGGTTIDNSTTITWNTAGTQSVSVKYDDQALTTPVTIYPVTVIPAVLTIKGVTANKIYDGSTAVSLNAYSAILIGDLANDVVTIDALGTTGTFEDKNVGTGKQVTTSGFKLSGPNAGNYVVTSPIITGNITPASLIIPGLTTNNKTYDGTTNATLNISSALLFGVIYPDRVTLDPLNANGTFIDNKAGSRKTVITTGFNITGADAANYYLFQPFSIADISRAEIGITGITANKVYNGTTTASLNTVSATLTGVIPSDNVLIIKTGATGDFSNKQVGSGITVTIKGFTLGGFNAGNYTLIQPVTTADIIPAALTLSGVTANKVYSGTVAIALNISAATLTGGVAPDIVSINTTGVSASFADKSVGTGKIINTSGFKLDGVDAVNYILTSPVITGNITPVTLTISGVTANNKTYDGNSIATLNTGSANLAGVIGTDVLTLLTSGATGTFASKNTASLIPLTTSGFTLVGADAANYVLIQPTTIAGITPFGVSLTIEGAVADNKAYDGTTTATLNTTNAKIVGAISTDIVTLNANDAIATFADKNAAPGKPVSTTGFNLNGADAINYTLNQPALTADINLASVTVTGITADNKVYDNTTTAFLNTVSATLIGVIPSDNLSLTKTGATGDFSKKQVGSGITVTTKGFTLGGLNAGNYTLIQPETTAAIIPAALTLSGVTANKVYSGTVAIVLNTSAATFTGVIAPDIVSINTTGVSASFADKNVGTGKIINATGFKLDGADAGNYVLTAPAITGIIIPVTLTISGITANSKAYDGTTVATLGMGSARLTVIIGSDLVTLLTSGATGTFANINTASGIVVTTSGFTLGGVDAANYTLVQPTTIASITPVGLSLTIAGVIADNKVYDGTTTATLNAANAKLMGVISPDVLTLLTSGATGTFVDKNAGTGKPVITTGFSINGQSAANYTLMQPMVQANILPCALPLTVTGVNANNKVYDGTTTAVLNTSSAILTGMISSDIVTLNANDAIATFADKNATPIKPVSTTGFNLNGADAINYTLNQPTLTADINLAPVTVTGITADNKVYDNTTTAFLNTVSATLTGVIPSDNLSLIKTGAIGDFSNKQVGSGITVTTKGFTLAGLNAGNYTLIQPITTATIIPAALTLSGVTADKVYSGTVAIALNTSAATFTGVIAPDIVSINTTGVSATFADKHVGTEKIINATGFKIDGANAGNYVLTATVIKGNITPVTLTISGITANSKAYDGTTIATLDFGLAGLTGIIGPDAVTLLTSGVTGTFADKNTASLIPVNTFGFTLGGVDAANYRLIQPTTIASITPFGVSLTIEGAVADNKAYDGTTTATLNTTNAKIVGAISTDVLNLNRINAIGTFVDKNAGTGKTIKTDGFSISGKSAVNYTLLQPMVQANILPCALQLTVTGVTANNKVYDGTTTAVLNAGSAILTGMISTDIVTLNANDAIGTFDDKNAAAGKPVSTTGFNLNGADAINYTLKQPILAAEINVAPLTAMGISTNDKVYDGNTTAQLNTGTAILIGAILNDDVKLSTTNTFGTFGDTNVGSGKIITPTSLFVSGTDAGNYTFIKPSFTADITPKKLDIISNGASKCFGIISTFIGSEYTTAGLIGNDSVNSVTLSSNGSLGTAALGTFEIVSTNAIGKGLSNYSLNYVNGILTVISLAKQPAEFLISTPTICSGTTGVKYSVPNDPLVTYNWTYSGTGVTLHENSNTATLDFSLIATSGILSVTASTTCGTSIARALSISANALKNNSAIVIVNNVLTSNIAEGNQWYKNMIPILGARGQNYTPIENGRYFSVSSNNSCNSDTSNYIDVIITNTTQYMNNTFQIFPNPAKEYFTLRSTDTMSETLRLSIFSSDCILMKNYEITNKSVNSEYHIDVRHLSPGLYFIRIDTNHKSITKKLIII